MMRRGISYSSVSGRWSGISLVCQYLIYTFFLCFSISLTAQNEEEHYLQLSAHLHKRLLKRPIRSTQQQLVQNLALQVSFDSLFQYAARHPTGPVVSALYNNVILLHNASVDDDVVLRQRINYTDETTTSLFAQRNRLLQQLARQYEWPASYRTQVNNLQIELDQVEVKILNRLKKGKAHFNALSIEVAHEMHRRKNTAASWLCYKKIKEQGGDSELAEALYRYTRTRSVNFLQWQVIRDNLSTHEVAVEIVTYRDVSANDGATLLHYGALLLQKGAKSPVFQPLCTAEELAQVLRPDVSDDLYLQYLYAPPSETGFSTLYSLIWQPLEQLLGQAKRIYFAPAGELHRINPAAIFQPDKGVPLQQQYEFVHINSARSLVNPSYQSADSPTFYLPCMSGAIPAHEIENLLGNNAFDYYAPVTTRDAVLFGHIVYDMDSVAIKNNQAAIVNQPMKAPLLKTRSRGDGNEWELLSGTQVEISLVKTLLEQSKYQVFTREAYSASEENFKTLGANGTSPRLIHVATHGFFLADVEGDSLEHPFNRSGLVLAGANFAWNSGFPMPGMEDGILTAFEIGQMNLQNTELVVLSACETGLGYIQNNEGVWGLQRAFKRAGVRNLLVSLWSVPDEATQQLMTKFYENCLKENMPMRAALSQAQQWMREQTDYRNPYYWAGFILLE
jgi:CHAT domain